MPKTVMALTRSYGWFVVSVFIGVRAVTGLAIDQGYLTVALGLLSALAVIQAVRTTPLPGAGSTNLDAADTSEPDQVRPSARG
jgi:hypothetical protein